MIVIELTNREAQLISNALDIYASKCFQNIENAEKTNLDLQAIELYCFQINDSMRLKSLIRKQYVPVEY